MASKGSRFLNYVLDTIALLILYVICGYLIGTLFPAIAQQPVEETRTLDPFTLIALTIFILYYTVTEGMLGQTFGKMLTRTQVVRTDGSKPSFGQVLGRSFARLIPFEPFSVLLKENGRGWHDSLPGTYVVKKR